MAPRSRRSRWPLAVIAALGLALAPPGDAAARKFQMSGNWIMRNGQVFIPLQFVTNGLMSHPSLHLSMGNLTGAFGFPNGPIPGQGGVTATGSAPATLRIPKHRFVEDAMAAVPLNGITLAQLTTNFGIDAPFQGATLAKNGGPGSFTWCPQDPACVAMAPPAMLGTDPPQGMGGIYNNGRVIYRAGANRFGGAMQMGLRRGGVNSAIYRLAPPVQIHQVFFGGSTLRKLAPGGLGGPDAPITDMAYVEAGFVSQPITYTPGKLIKKAGPKVTTMGGLTPGATGPLLLPTVLYSSAGGKKIGQFTTNYGFGHTTGTVFVQQNQYGGDFFTFMGYDKRTPLGAGNIQVVAGGLGFRNTKAGRRPYASLHRVRMSLAPPIPSLSPPGFAAAGLLVLLAAGYAVRPRGREVQGARGDAGGSSEC